MIENNIPENENIPESTDTDSTQLTQTESTETENDETTKTKKEPRKPSYLLQILAGGYLTYLGIDLINQIRKNATEMNPLWLFVTASIIFTLFGGFACIRSIIALYKENKANIMPYYTSDNEDESDETLDDED